MRDPKNTQPCEARTEAWPMLQDMMHNLIAGDDQLAKCNDAILATLLHGGPDYFGAPLANDVLKVLELFSAMLLVQAQMRKEVSHAIS